MDRKRLHALLHRFKMDGVVEFIKGRDGIERVSLTDRGRARLLWYQFNNLKLRKNKKGDRKWRLVLFDIPEEKKKIRDAFRRKLKLLGFLEFQKSVFIYPYFCADEINFVINFYSIAEHDYYLEAPISPDRSFRSHFNLK